MAAISGAAEAPDELRGEQQFPFVLDALARLTATHVRWMTVKGGIRRAQGQDEFGVENDPRSTFHQLSLVLWGGRLPTPQTDSEKSTGLGGGKFDPPDHSGVVWLGFRAL